MGEWFGYQPFDPTNPPQDAPPKPDPVKDAIAAGHVVIDTSGEYDVISFRDQLDSPRVEAGTEPLDLVYTRLRDYAEPTTSVTGTIDDDGRLVGIGTCGLTNTPHPFFVMGMDGLGVREWAAARFEITEWRKLTDTMEISASVWIDWRKLTDAAEISA